MSPAAELQRLLTAFWVLPCAHAVAELRIPEALSAGPRSASELAQLCTADADALERVLRSLCALGVFAEDAEGRFSLTPMSELLRGDVPNSVRPYMMMMGGELSWRAWGSVRHSLVTGHPALEQLLGRSYFEHLADHPKEAQIFDAAMESSSSIDKNGILASYDFTRFTSLVDVGGGIGGMLIPILERAPAATAVLFDRPKVAEAALPMVQQAGLTERVKVVGGDFFESVPEGGSAYLLKSILHDWRDADAVRILKTVRRAMKAGTTLLVVERILSSEDQSPQFGRIVDLIMLVLLGGRERTAAEYTALLQSAGFAVTRIVKTQAPQSVIEAVAVQ